jgi:oxalate decarboxylase/phosphoglucose isomerase-like protein (cupin superfamily)
VLATKSCRQSCNVIIVFASLNPLVAVKSDRVLGPGYRGDRKIVATEMYPSKERPAQEVTWQTALRLFGKMPGSSHVEYGSRRLKGSELYMVLEGLMPIELEGEIYRLGPGDMIIVHPGSIHEVKKEGANFLARVVTVNCGGAPDRYDVSSKILKPISRFAHPMRLLRTSYSSLPSFR